MLWNMTHSTLFDHLFQMPLPVAEKIIRPILVYVALVLLVRIFGKRELAQLNPFDLVVLLSLSNTVQNAIIGNDNSVSGGIIGAFTLLAINWFVVRLLFRSPKLTRIIEGKSAILIKNGHLDKRALERESLTREELLAVVHRQGFEGFHQVYRCELEPNGTFYLEPFDPSSSDKQHAELIQRIDTLTQQVAALRPGV